MTHDELLARIKHYEVMPRPDMPETFSSFNTFFAALRAIVELHKPNGYHYANVCDVCDAIYPCPTIQAIEKELK